jgi:hypothetical protein
MVIAEGPDAHVRGGVERGAGSAFGLVLETRRPLPGVVSGNASGSRATTIRFVTPERLARAWPRRDASRLVDRRLPDGRAMLTIEHHSRKGYRVWAPRHGSYLVASDGSRIAAAIPRRPGWQWQRLFFAQVLPLAAALQGLDLFHASGVVVGEGAIGLVAASGTGKSSVAAHMIAGGAGFLTDDVLALERANGGIRAHPGSLLMGVHEAELQALNPEGSARLGWRVGRADKSYFLAAGAPGPFPLQALYFLERMAQSKGRARLEIVPGDRNAARSLLAASFLAYLQSPARLLVHLDVCARLASAVGVFRVRIPSSVSARETAAAVQAHAVSRHPGNGP